VWRIWSAAILGTVGVAAILVAPTARECLARCGETAMAFYLRGGGVVLIALAVVLALLWIRSRRSSAR
jgi:hypothetical protein